MKVVYYSFTSYLDTFLPKVTALSKLVDLTAIVEMTPWSWSKSLFDIPMKELPAGMVSSEQILSGSPREILERYSPLLKGVKFLSFTNPRSLHPANWKTAYAGARSIAKHKPDIVHFDGATLIFAPGLLFMESIPVVLDVHDGRIHKGEENWRTDLARYFCYRRTSRFITHSRFSKAQLTESANLSPDRISTVRLGPLDIFRKWAEPGRAARPNTVLFFGRISHYKGLDVLLRSVSIVREKIPAARFVIAGRPVFGFDLQGALAASGSSNVEVIDRYLSNSELARLFQEATLVVCPYVEATQSGVILTAYGFGKPVVATNVGGLPEYVWDGETGRIIPPNDPAALAAAIVEVLRDPGMNAGIGPALSRRKKELSWDTWAEKVVEVYNQVLEEKKGRRLR